ncbi:uncharacterized protein EV154DRAFT_488976 [Mucor mucedo]|uniref:uncharacterized protein n=1 Tax=Mucor mucedo TaxID=29922 RepID=UPI00221E8F0C|nr:uncharacterized protein EV154DRAFT_488976 [Mucor mucedo]KAI7864020.1 hypothetical protein EV154DRAFT_488976 [Mucor mucedo]
MPKFMIGLVALVTDVDGDGNCGFQTIAASVGKEDVLRTAISVGVEVNDNNKTHYLSYIFADCIMEYEELLKSINLSYRGGCEINNWMIMNSTESLYTKHYTLKKQQTPL